MNRQYRISYAEMLQQHPVHRNKTSVEISISILAYFPGAERFFAQGCSTARMGYVIG